MAGEILKLTQVFRGIRCTDTEYAVINSLVEARSWGQVQTRNWLAEVRDKMSTSGQVKTSAEIARARLDALQVADKSSLGKTPAVVAEPAVADSVSATLAQRGSRYGDFTDHAKICQDLKDVMVNSSVNMPDLTTATESHREFRWHKLLPIQKQALEVIMDKVARILSGDPNYDDNWHDIQGYAKLVEDRLPKESKI